MIKLIMISGGTESTGLLFRELGAWKDGDNTQLIHAHHIRMINQEGRHSAEDQAIRYIVKEARKIREFGFSQNAIGIPDAFGTGYVGADLLSIGFMAGHIARQIIEAMNQSKGIIPELVAYIGSSKTEQRDPAMRANNSARAEMMQYVFASHFLDLAKQGIKPPRIERPLLDVETWEIQKEIPKFLLAWVVSCRRPVYLGKQWVACGSCHACSKMGTVKKERAANEQKIKVARTA